MIYFKNSQKYLHYYLCPCSLKIQLANDFTKLIHLDNVLQFENNGLFIKSNYAR